MRELTKAEVDLVAGGLGPIGGGVAGGASYVGSTLISGGNLNWSDAAAAVALGAVTSGYSALGGTAVTGIGNAARQVISVARGILVGGAVAGATREPSDPARELEPTS
ncbi:MAG: hypothetical protein ACFHX7_07800 [Pseudomonadota bacterium]